MARLTQMVVEVVISSGNAFEDIDAIPGYFGVILENTPVTGSTVPHGGQNNLLIELNNNVTVPNDSKWYGLRALSGAAPVSHGKSIAYGGWIKLGEDTFLPSNVDGVQRLGVRFYDFNFVEVQSNLIILKWSGDDPVFPMDRFAPASLVQGYKYVSTDPNATGGTAGLEFEGPIGPAFVPATASWMRFECGAFIRNRSDAGFETGDTAVYIQARFDDVFAVWLQPAA